MRREPSRDAKTQNAVAALSNCDLKRAPELYLPATANHGHAWAGHDTCLKREPCYSHKLWPIHTTQ